MSLFVLRACSLIATVSEPKTSIIGAYLDYSELCIQKTLWSPLSETERFIGDRCSVPADSIDLGDGPIQVCSDHRLFPEHTYFCDKNGYWLAWHPHSPSQLWNQIDHIVVGRRWHGSIDDCRSFWSTSGNSNHGVSIKSAFKHFDTVRAARYSVPRKDYWGTISEDGLVYLHDFCALSKPRRYTSRSPHSAWRTFTTKQTALSPTTTLLWGAIDRKIRFARTCVRMLRSSRKKLERSHARFGHSHVNCVDKPDPLVLTSTYVVELSWKIRDKPLCSLWISGRHMGHLKKRCWCK